MAILASPTDVETSLGRSLTSDEGPRALALLTLASAEVKDKTGRRFAPGSYTVGRRVRSGRVRLPGAVAAITQVRDIDQGDGTVTILTADVDYTSHRRTIYGLGSRAFVEVDFTVTADIPDDVVNLVAGIAAATLAGPPTGAASQSAGTYSISYVNSSGKVWLSASDKAILAKYGAGLKPALDLL